MIEGVADVYEQVLHRAPSGTRDAATDSGAPVTHAARAGARGAPPASERETRARRRRSTPMVFPSRACALGQVRARSVRGRAQCNAPPRHSHASQPSLSPPYPSSSCSRSLGRRAGEVQPTPRPRGARRKSTPQDSPLPHALAQASQAALREGAQELAQARARQPRAAQGAALARPDARGSGYGQHQRSRRSRAGAVADDHWHDLLCVGIGL